MQQLFPQIMPKRTAKRIWSAIQDASHIVLVPHQHPDGDALGSVTALGHYLDRLGKSYRIFCATDMTPKLKYLPHLDKLTTDTDIWEDRIDLVIVVDSGNLGYAGVDEHIASLKKTPTIINIDHHKTNTEFGHLNLVLEKAASTTEILYQFFRYNKIDIDPDMATSLLTGLVTDTDNFTNAATSKTSLRIASDLIQAGGNLGTIKGWVFKDKSIDALKLWGVVLSRLSKHDRHDIVYTYLTNHDMDMHNVSPSDIEGLANFLTIIGDGKAGLILHEKPDGSVKGSFRTTRDDVDVAHIAQKLGGGGHQKAAGFNLAGTIEEALEHIWQTIDGLEAATA